MNEFILRIKALRIEFKASQVSIQKDSERSIGHINTAIGQVTIPEVKNLLRNERSRIISERISSQAWNKKNYLQQLEQINDEKRLYFQDLPSKRALRRAASASAE